MRIHLSLNVVFLALLGDLSPDSFVIVIELPPSMLLLSNCLQEVDNQLEFEAINGTKVFLHAARIYASRLLVASIFTGLLKTIFFTLFVSVPLPKQVWM